MYTFEVAGGGGETQMSSTIIGVDSKPVATM